ncbi:MAG: urate hydroxylase PuuD [Myxococcota bacterium]
MEHATDWLSLSLRWLHIVAGAAWIGTSFYFNWLNNNLRPPEKTEAGVGGELWSVHGGHFYRVIKYTVAPEKLPKILHWFKWEAYVTWLSGFALLAVVYYLNPSLYLVDTAVRPLAGYEAIGIGLGTLVGGFLIYHLLCKSPLGRSPTLFAMIGLGLFTALAFGLTQVFGSRAAYIHVGALVGTIMAGNVFFVIIPNQRVMVDAMVAKREPDPTKGLEAAQRSLHNNYLTLPVLFIMVSNHYPFTFGDEWNWALLAGISIVGAGIRHWFNLRGQGRKNVYILPVAALGMVGLTLVSAPKSYADHPPVAFADVRTVMENRCTPCHSATPTHFAFLVAPQGIMFDTPEQIVAMAQRINAVAVASQTMPLANMTEMTLEERDLLGAWVYQGAQITEESVYVASSEANAGASGGSSDGAPSQEGPPQEASPQEAPSQEGPPQEAPSQEAPSQEAPSQEAPSQEAPSQEAPSQEALLEEPVEPEGLGPERLGPERLGLERLGLEREPRVEP